MLINCPECGNTISDKAVLCVQCGCPLQKEQKIKPKKNKRRLPNGFGQITYIKSGNLRNPYRVMVTVGKTEEGKYIQKLLKPNAYFPTYNQAYIALVEYNKNPYELESLLTVKELYEKWSKMYFETIKTESTRNIKSAWSYCSQLYDCRVRDLRARHIKLCMETGTVNINGEIRPASAGTKARIKSMFNLMLDYAVEYELVDKNYARAFDLPDDIVKEQINSYRKHIPFTEEELNILWANTDFPYVKVVLFQCYGGWRPQELGLIRLENVHLEEGYIVGGMKTEAGTDRIVPIHSAIRPFVEEFYDEATRLESDYLLNVVDGTTHKSNWRFTYDKYKTRFSKIRIALKLNFEHRPHDPRNTFITFAKAANMDEYAIKYIVGHEIQDVTERVYTERTIQWLQSEIEKIGHKPAAYLV